ncbi:PIG-L family deacetylase [Allosphingosinicella flava]|uniref:PIG-L family deacetylase n=1 Tax=Allosphingosinicella flava TaxID=2771430 RepID=A0A7T2LML0_9SPHN|nr:PIG-L family deacetylase [Sphingosinicella flava]QPQ55388.1 PIG-L family deacetylase [Sphingosinicella flava]
MTCKGEATIFDPQCDTIFFLQPHSDDIALSCGATAAGFAAAGRDTRIITVFVGETVPEMVGPFAEWKHSRWSLHDVDAVRETRRQEDIEAAAVLGCALRWLGLPDAIYRGDRYKRDEELFGELSDEELALADHLVEELEGLPEWRRDSMVFVPLGIGAHVDHQILFETGALLAARGYAVFAYEDTPYIIHSPEGRAARLAQVGDAVGEPFSHGVAGTMDAKLDAISRYRSQLPVIFRFTDDYRAAVQRYACEVGNGTPAERFWPVRST